MAAANPAWNLSACCLSSGPTSCTLGTATAAQVRAPLSASSTDSCDRLTARFQWPEVDRDSASSNMILARLKLLSAAPWLVKAPPHPRA